MGFAVARKMRISRDGRLDLARDVLAVALARRQVLEVGGGRDAGHYQRVHAGIVEQGLDAAGVASRWA